MTKIWRQIFSNELPIWFRILNSIILLPMLLWPFVFYITVFFFDHPDHSVIALLLFIVVNIYPLYLVLLAYLNTLLFKSNKVLGIILPSAVFILLIYGVIAYIITTRNIISKSIERENDRKGKGYIGASDDYKIKNNQVYNKDTLIVGADAKTFEIVSWDWERDKNYYYRFGKVVSAIDRKSFQLLDYHYAKDKFHVFYDENIIVGADAKTFMHLEGTQDGKDKNGCYRWGEKVDCKVLQTEY